MLLSPSMIKELVANMQLAIRDEAHFKQLMDGLCNTINDKHLDNSFDSFAFAWELLPQWARVLVLRVAYRESKTSFENINPHTPITLFTDTQRHALSLACDKLLTSIVTLFVDYHFTEDFYKGWLDARRSHLTTGATSC